MDEFTESVQSGRPKAPTEHDYRNAAKLREALRGFLRESDRITRAWGLTRQRYELLLAIRTASGRDALAPMQELQESLQLAQSSLVELVDRAEALGLVVRSRDRRRVVIGLSAEGERRLAGALAELNQHREHLLAHLAGLRAPASPVQRP